MMNFKNCGIIVPSWEVSVFWVSLLATRDLSEVIWMEKATLTGLHSFYVFSDTNDAVTSH